VRTFIAEGTGYFDDFEIAFTHGQGWLQVSIEKPVLVRQKNDYRLF